MLSTILSLFRVDRIMTILYQLINYNNPVRPHLRQPLMIKAPPIQRPDNKQEPMDLIQELKLVLRKQNRYVQ